jgi:hypothetical protein
MGLEDRCALTAPDKRYLISTLVRDIDFASAIVGLIDNSVDGARRMRVTWSKDRLAGLAVDLTVADDRFGIVDNCGGIDIDRARQIASCLGTPGEETARPGELGMFGLGLKRALFKLGNNLSVTSTAADSRFSLPVSVPSWLRDRSADWSFQLVDVDCSVQAPDAERGTRIEVTDLHVAAARVLGSERFVSRLRAEIELRHLRAIQQGLVVHLNGAPLRATHPSLLSSEEFAPLVKRCDVAVGGRCVRMEVYAGLDRADDQDDDETDDASKYRTDSQAGWYLFCNDRLVLARDKSRLTGWGAVTSAYHPQYRQFRGYVFLEGDARDMPWTTTKTAVDEDSPAFRIVQAEMFDALQKAVVAMNRLRAERQQRPPEERPAVSAMHAARRVPLADLQPSAAVRVPAPSAGPLSPSMMTIRYAIEQSQYARAAMELGVDCPADVGRDTFRFYVQAQVAD